MRDDFNIQLKGAESTEPNNSQTTEHQDRRDILGCWEKRKTTSWLFISSHLRPHVNEKGERYDIGVIQSFKKLGC